jgi:hypothetical protein
VRPQRDAGEDEESRSNERERLRKRPLVTEQPGVRRVERRFLRVVLRSPDRDVYEAVRDENAIKSQRSIA